MTKLGFWVGKPLPYDASVVEIDGAASRRASVDPTFGAGLAYVPNAYVTLLVGLGHNRITIPETMATEAEDAQPERLRRFVNVIIGLGGNFDVLGTLIR